MIDILLLKEIFFERNNSKDNNNTIENKENGINDNKIEKKD